MLVHDLSYASFRKVGHPIGVVKRRDVPDVMSTLPTFWQRSVRNVRNSSRYLRRDTAVKKDATRGPGESTPVFEHLEEWTRGRIQEWMQELLVEEVTELLGRGRYDQRGIDAYRNGFAGQLTMRTGTISVHGCAVSTGRILVREEDPPGEGPDAAAGDFDLALRGLLGEKAALSASTVTRLKERWHGEIARWNQRRLEDAQIVYLWVDAVYLKAGLEREKAALLHRIFTARRSSR